MTTAAFLGMGTHLQREIASVFTTIAEITDIGGPDLDSDDVEVTNHDSAGWREFIAGLKQGGEVKFSGNFLPANSTQQQLITDQAAGTYANWKIVLSDAGAGTWAFSARVKSINFKTPAKDAVTFDAVLKISGAATFTP